MNKLKTKYRQFAYKIKYDFLTIDNVILLVAGAFCFAWTCGSIGSISRNWDLAQMVAERKRELALMQLEVDTLELENDYYKSSEYQELAARRLANKKAPGEMVVYLPTNSDAAKNKHSDITTSEKALYTDDRTNFEQWMDFLFGA